MGSVLTTSHQPPADTVPLDGKNCVKISVMLRFDKRAFRNITYLLTLAMQDLPWLAPKHVSSSQGLKPRSRKMEWSIPVLRQGFAEH